MDWGKDEPMLSSFVFGSSWVSKESLKSDPWYYLKDTVHSL